MYVLWRARLVLPMLLLNAGICRATEICKAGLKWSYVQGRVEMKGHA